MMAVAVGAASVYTGLVASYHLDLAGGAAMATIAVASSFETLAATRTFAAFRRRDPSLLDQLGPTAETV